MLGSDRSPGRDRARLRSRIHISVLASHFCVDVCHKQELRGSRAVAVHIRRPKHLVQSRGVLPASE